MAGAEAIVGADEVLPLVERKIELVSRVVPDRRVVELQRARNHRTVGFRDRAPVRRDAVGRNDVSRKWLAGERVPDRGRSSREVALQFPQRRHRAAERTVDAIERFELEAAEKEQAVSPNRPAETDAVIVEVELSLDAVAVGVFRREVLRRIERFVPKRLESAAPIAIRPAPCHNVDGGAGIPAVLG